MKKIIALLLVLVMVLGVFAGCSPAKKDDTGSTNPSEGAGNGEGNGEGAGITIPAYKFGMNIADPIALIALFMGSAPEGDDVPDIENVYFETQTDLNAGKALATFGANLFDKDYAVNIFGSENSVVVNAPGLHDKNYGISFEDMMSLYSDLLLGMGGATDPDMEAVGMTSITSLLPLLAENSETLGKMVDKYVELLITEIKVNAQVTEAADGSNTKTTYTLNADSLGMITANVLDAFFTDTEAVALLKKLGVDTDSILATKPSKAELQESYKQMFASIGNPVLTAAITTDSAKAIVAIDASLVIADVTMLTFAYDKAAGTFSLLNDEDPSDANKTSITGKTENGTTTIQMTDIASYGDGITYTDKTIIVFGNGVISLKAISSDSTGFSSTQELKAEVADSSIALSASLVTNVPNPENYLFDPTANDFAFTAKLEWTDSSITLTADYNDMKTVVAITDKDGKVEGKLTMDGEEMGSILFDKAVSGNKTTYTLKSLVYGGVTVDFSDVGLSFYFETGITVPDAPASYTNIAELDEAALQEILAEIMEDNEELISKFVYAETVPNI